MFRQSWVVVTLLQMTANPEKKVMQTFNCLKSITIRSPNYSTMQYSTNFIDISMKGLFSVTKTIQLIELFFNNCVLTRLVMVDDDDDDDNENNDNYDYWWALGCNDTLQTAMIMSKCLMYPPTHQWKACVCSALVVEIGRAWLLRRNNNYFIAILTF